MLSYLLCIYQYIVVQLIKNHRYINKKDNELPVYYKSEAD